MRPTWANKSLFLLDGFPEYVSYTLTISTTSKSGLAYQRLPWKAARIPECSIPSDVLGYTCKKICSDRLIASYLL